MTNVAVLGIDIDQRSKWVGLVRGLLTKKGLKPVKRYQDADYVLCFGLESFKEVTGFGMKHSDARDKIHGTETRIVWTTYHPRTVAMNPKLMRTFKYSIEDFADLVKLDAGGTL